MNIYLGADHRGFALKETLKPWLQKAGHTVHDLGASELDKDDDYPDYAIAVAKKVAGDSTSRGVVVCGSGVGMAVAANKLAGIRAVVAHDKQLARASRTDDDTNVIALGADFINAASAKEVLAAWLATDFSAEERHQRRLQKISALERQKS